MEEDDVTISSITTPNSIASPIEEKSRRSSSYKEPYHVPKEVKPHDIEALKEIDERKLIELKEVKSVVFIIIFHF